MRGVLSWRAAVPLIGLVCIVWSGAATAASVSFKVPLTGAEQVPAVTTTGSGTADLTWDPSTRDVTWSVAYNNLSGPVTMAHFHGGAKGKNGPVTIWLTKKDSPVTSPISGKATLTPEQAKDFAAGDWYINVHTKDHPSGEIRGQVVPPKS